MRDEIVVIGSGKRLNGWLPSILSECPYRLRFAQVPQQPVSAGGDSAVSGIPFHTATRACILQQDLDLAGWTQALLQEQKGPVLWAVSSLNQDVLNLLDEIGVKGILTPNTDRLAAVCSIKTAVAGWRNELFYRKRAEKALAELNNRKLIDRAKGVLMDRFELSEAEAYARIRREAMRNRKSMVQIAESILLLQDLTSC